MASPGGDAMGEPTPPPTAAAMRGLDTVEDWRSGQRRC
jgi:hypothetical protein